MFMPLRGRHSKGKGKGIRAPQALSRAKSPLPRPLLTPAPQATLKERSGYKQLSNSSVIMKNISNQPK